MADVERKLGVVPIEELLHERATLVDRVADLRARYGPFGTWEAIRKSELARLNALLRGQYTKAEVKVTEAQLDTGAHAHPDYLALIAEATTQRAELARLEAQIEAIEFTIRRADAVIRFTSAEARL